MPQLLLSTSLHIHGENFKAILATIQRIAILYDVKYAASYGTFRGNCVFSDPVTPQPARIAYASDNMSSLDLPSRLLGRIIHPHARS